MRLHLALCQFRGFESVSYMRGSLYGRLWMTGEERAVELDGESIVFAGKYILSPDVVEDIRLELRTGRDVLVLHYRDDYFVRADEESPGRVLVSEGGCEVALIDSDGNEVDFEGAEGVFGDYLIVVRYQESCFIDHGLLRGIFTAGGAFEVVR